jgi:Tfp pilus assembly protein PilE
MKKKKLRKRFLISSFTFIELLVVVGIISLFSLIILTNLNKLKERVKYRLVWQEMLTLEKAFEYVHIFEGKTLGQFTGGWCSDCSCRSTTPAKDIPDCVNSWRNVVDKLYQIGAISKKERFYTDPWGSPYLLDENELEGNNCSPDWLVSVGPDLRFNPPYSNDNIVRRLPYLICSGKSGYWEFNGP